MFVECVAELQSIFPTHLQPLDDAELFEERNRTIDAGTVDALAGRDDFTHTLRLLVLQRLEHDFARSRQAVAVLFKRSF